MHKKKREHGKRHYSLGDLILAVSAHSKNHRETVAAVADLMEAGRLVRPAPDRERKSPSERLSD